MIISMPQTGFYSQIYYTDSEDQSWVAIPVWPGWSYTGDAGGSKDSPVHSGHSIQNRRGAREIGQCTREYR